MSKDIEHYPYVSQWADPRHNAQILAGADPCADPAWRHSSGFSCADLYRFWSGRICGVACFQSLLLFRRRQGLPVEPSLVSRYAIWRAAFEAGAYKRREDGSVLGLIYAPFVAMIGSLYAIEGEVETGMTQDRLEAFLRQRRPVMASVTPRIRGAEGINPEPERNGGHLVLCYGLAQGRVWFNNPSGTEAAPHHSSLPLEIFYSWCAGRGIVF